MKRALAVFSVLAVLGFSGFAMGTFSGEWDTNIHVLPSLQLDYTKLILNYTDFGWTFTSISKFDSSGYVYQKFGATGAFGPFTVKGNMWFDPVNVAYMASDLSTTMDFAGLSLGLTARHWVYPYWNPDNAWYPDTNPCSQQTGDAGLQYILTAKVDPISIKLRFMDCCTGTAFQDLKVNLKGIGLCCGISLNSELYFTKAGFKYVKFSGINIPLCCGVSLDLAVKFGVDYKAIYVTPKFAGLGEGCFTVYAVPDITGTDSSGKATGAISWSGIDVKAWAIECKLGDCNYVKFVTALDPGWYNSNVEEVFEGNEFEYMELGFCGAGCCGGKYTVDLSVYFQQSGSLFGITRIGANMSIPVMSNFAVNVSFSTPNTLDIGWTFTF
jgi:hypothetical protein